MPPEPETTQYRVTYLNGAPSPPLVGLHTLERWTPDLRDVARIESRATRDDPWGRIR